MSAPAAPNAMVRSTRLHAIAVALPIPDVPPVTKATLLSSIMMSLFIVSVEVT
jgi:hypothetical protein